MNDHIVIVHLEDVMVETTIWPHSTTDTVKYTQSSKEVLWSIFCGFGNKKWTIRTLAFKARLNDISTKGTRLP